MDMDMDMDMDVDMDMDIDMDMDMDMDMDTDMDLDIRHGHGSCWPRPAETWTHGHGHGPRTWDSQHGQGLNANGTTNTVLRSTLYGPTMLRIYCTMLLPSSVVKRGERSDAILVLARRCYAVRAISQRISKKVE